jgi:hypothetical protein
MARGPLAKPHRMATTEVVRPLPRSNPCSRWNSRAAFASNHAAKAWNSDSVTGGFPLATRRSISNNHHHAASTSG